MGTIRKFVGWLPYVGGFLAFIAAIEWVEYHTTKGNSPIWGRNPRCIDQSGYCFNLDTSNMSWDATLATWLSVGGWYLFMAFMFAVAVYLLAGAIAGIGLLTQVARTPPQERLSLIANNRRLEFIALGLLGLLLVGVVALLLWTQFVLVAVLLIIPGGVLAAYASGWVSAWAARYRHERFLATLENKSSD